MTQSYPAHFTSSSQEEDGILGIVIDDNTPYHKNVDDPKRVQYVFTANPSEQHIREVHFTVYGSRHKRAGQGRWFIAWRSGINPDSAMLSFRGYQWMLRLDKKGRWVADVTPEQVMMMIGV